MPTGNVMPSFKVPSPSHTACRRTGFSSARVVVASSATGNRMRLVPAHRHWQRVASSPIEPRQAQVGDADHHDDVRLMAVRSRPDATVRMVFNRCVFYAFAADCTNPCRPSLRRPRQVAHSAGRRQAGGCIARPQAMLRFISCVGARAVSGCWFAATGLSSLLPKFEFDRHLHPSSDWLAIAHCRVEVPLRDGSQGGVDQ